MADFVLVCMLIYDHGILKDVRRGRTLKQTAELSLAKGCNVISSLDLVFSPFSELICTNDTDNLLCATVDVNSISNNSLLHYFDVKNFRCNVKTSSAIFRTLPLFFA